jgi:hypothetical protein
MTSSKAANSVVRGDIGQFVGWTAAYARITPLGDAYINRANRPRLEGEYRARVASPTAAVGRRAVKRNAPLRLKSGTRCVERTHRGSEEELRKLKATETGT